MRSRTVHMQQNQIIAQQFDTFRTHLTTEHSAKDEEREEMAMRIEQLQEQIRKVNERAMHLQILNEKLNQIIVNYHTKDNIKFDQFLQKVNHLVHKTNTVHHENKSLGQKNIATTKNQTKISKSNSIQKLTNYQQSGPFLKMKTQQANTVYDENNSLLANVQSSGLGRGQLRKKLGRMMCTRQVR